MTNRPKKTKITRTKSGLTIRFSKKAGQAFARSINEGEDKPLANRIADAVKSEDELRAELRRKIRPQMLGLWEDSSQ